MGALFQTAHNHLVALITTQCWAGPHLKPVQKVMGQNRTEESQQHIWTMVYQGDASDSDLSKPPMTGSCHGRRAEWENPGQALFILSLRTCTPILGATGLIVIHRQ